MRRTILDHTPDGLKRRIADLERQVADLQRVRNPPQSYNEVQGGVTEAFYTYCYNHDTTTSDEDLPLSWDYGYYTAGISPSTPTVTLGPGLWLIDADVEIRSMSGGTPTAPTQASVGISLESPEGTLPDRVIPYSDFVAGSSYSRQVGLPFQFFYPSPWSLSVRIRKPGFPEINTDFRVSASLTGACLGMPSKPLTDTR